MLEKIKVLLGITDNTKDTLISLYVDMAKEEATSFCQMSEYSTELYNIVIMMVIEKFSKRGNEGLSSTGYSGVSESFKDGYSAEIKSALLAHRKLVLI